MPAAIASNVATLGTVAAPSIDIAPPLEARVAIHLAGIRRIAVALGPLPGLAGAFVTPLLPRFGLAVACSLLLFAGVTRALAVRLGRTRILQFLVTFPVLGLVRFDLPLLPFAFDPALYFCATRCGTLVDFSVPPEKLGWARKWLRGHPRVVVRERDLPGANGDYAASIADESFARVDLVIGPGRNVGTFRVARGVIGGFVIGSPDADGGGRSDDRITLAVDLADEPGDDAQRALHQRDRAAVPCDCAVRNVAVGFNTHPRAGSHCQDRAIGHREKRPRAGTGANRVAFFKIKPRPRDALAAHGCDPHVPFERVQCSDGAEKRRRPGATERCRQP